MVLKFLLSGFCPSLFIIGLLCLTPCLPSWNHENSVAPAVRMLPFQLFNYSAPGAFYPILYQSNPDLILRRSNSGEWLRWDFTLLFVFWLWMVGCCGRHTDMFLLFLPFPQHLHHTAKIRLLFLCSSLLTNRVQHYGCLLEGSWSGLTLFPFVLYHVPCSPSKYFSLSKDDEAAPQREINGHWVVLVCVSSLELTHRAGLQKNPRKNR